MRGSVTWVRGKMMEPVLLESLLGHMENEEVVGDSQHGFTSGRANHAWTNAMASSNGLAALVDKGRASEVACLDLGKAFGTVWATMVVSTLGRGGLAGWSPGWMGNWLMVTLGELRSGA